MCSSCVGFVRFAVSLCGRLHCVGSLVLLEALLRGSWLTPPLLDWQPAGRGEGAVGAGHEIDS